jgi:hypothetical protein
MLDSKTFGSDTKLNHHFFQQLKLIGKGKFNHLIISLILCLLPNQKGDICMCYYFAWRDSRTHLKMNLFVQN